MKLHQPSPLYSIKAIDPNPRPSSQKHPQGAATPLDFEWTKGVVVILPVEVAKT